MALKRYEYHTIESAACWSWFGRMQKVPLLFCSRVATRVKIKLIIHEDIQCCCRPWAVQC